MTIYIVPPKKIPDDAWLASDPAGRDCMTQIMADIDASYRDEAFRAEYERWMEDRA